MPSDVDMARWRGLAVSRPALPRTEPMIEWCAQAQDAITELLSELEALRAERLLTDEELAAVIDAQGCMRGHCNRNDKWHVAAIAGLSKLIARTTKEGSRG